MNAGVFSGNYKWRLNDISKTKEKEISSPAFYVGSYRWCISFFPHGDEDVEVPDCIRCDLNGLSALGAVSLLSRFKWQRLRTSVLGA